MTRISAYLDALEKRIAVRNSVGFGAMVTRIGCTFFIALLVLAFGPPPVAAQSSDICEPLSLQINIQVEHVRSSTGWVTAVLYDDNPDNFLKTGRRSARVRVPAMEGPMEVCIAAPGPGRYALAIFHDENANRRLDQGFLGIPKEGFGFSNNPGLRLGPPRLSDTLFEVDGTAISLHIGLRYL